jgi:phosphoribosylformylglycinamidine (FGAM) synthase-like amidotransferase family enzyme
LIGTSPPFSAQCFEGGFEFSEGISAKWIFDVDIEKLRAEFFLAFEKTKILPGVCESQLIESSRPTFIAPFSNFPIDF